MANPVVEGAICACSFGKLPLPLAANSQKTVHMCTLTAATVLDAAFASFGMCSCPNNPAVMAATAAAMGTPTPAPCVPAIVPPWKPGSTGVNVCGQPLLNDSSKLTCAYGGVIQVQITPAKTVKCP